MSIYRNKAYNRASKLFKLLNLLRKQKRKLRIIKFRLANRKFNRNYGLKVMAELNDLEFKHLFRMNRQSFKKLVDLLNPILQYNKLQAIRSSGSPITVTTRLACTLRWLAGGSYLDIATLFGISIKNFFHKKGVLWPTIEAIDKVLNIEFCHFCCIWLALASTYW